MKKILIIMLTFLLFSCWEENQIVEEVVKKDFFIEVKTIDDFSKELNLKKTWKLSSSQDINLSSQISWRVSQIYVVEWEYVRKGDVISRLDDNIANYWFTLERAQNSLDKALINYESTENMLNKQISDIKINLDNLKIDQVDSKSSLELSKLENSINKLTLDYDNLKISNVETISWFNNSMWKDLTSFTIFLDDIIDFSDKLLWVTSKNKDENNSFETYLWAKNTNQKKITENLLRELITYRSADLLIVNFDWNNDFDSNVNIISDWYSKINLLLTSLDITLDSSIESAWSFTEAQISSYRANVSGFQASYNLKNWAFITLNNSINSFLKTYENNEESLSKQIELLESDKKIYVKWLDVRLEIDESTLNEAISNKNLTLRQLDTIITDSRITYKQALNNVDKLWIKSPINWTIAEIMIDVWQEVWMWTTLFNILNNSNNEISIWFSKEELNFINSWNKAIVKFEDIVYTWSVYSISNVADKNLKYIWKVSIEQGIKFIWNIVNVDIPFSTEKNILPINIIKIDNSWKWIINILNDWKIVKKTVTLWNIYFDKVEILGEFDLNDEIIITNIDKFDINKFNLKIK